VQNQRNLDFLRGERESKRGIHNTLDKYTTMFTEDITAIVVDPGSLTIRAGYSGEDTPRMVMPS